MHKLIGISALLILLSGCAFPSEVPSSVANAYPDTPKPTDIRGSTKQTILSRTYPYSREQVLAAVKKGALRMGLNTDKVDDEKGIVVASGNGIPNGPWSFAFYVKQINDTPQTRLTIIADVYQEFLFISSSSYGINLAFTTIQDILSHE